MHYNSGPGIIPHPLPEVNFLMVELHKTFELTHLQAFLAQLILQLHFTKLCPSTIDNKRPAVSRALNSVYEST